MSILILPIIQNILELLIMFNIMNTIIILIVFKLFYLITLRVSNSHIYLKCMYLIIIINIQVLSLQSII